MKIMLDSGAYTIFQKGMKIDIDRYAEFVKTHIDTLYKYINMDAIGDGAKSLENWKYLRKKGIDPIPVFHIGTNEKFLQEYLFETDYVAIGAIANLSSNKRIDGLDYIWRKYLLDKNGIVRYKIHGLGLTALPIMERYPWYSVDSISAVFSAGMGIIYLPFFRDGIPQYENSFLCKISNQSNHKVGSITQWPNLPFEFKEECKKLMKEFGFEIGQVYYQKKRKVRGQKVQKEHYKFFDLANDFEDNKNKLSGDWSTRFQWNLKILKEITKTFNKYTLKNETIEYQTNVFVGCSNTIHFREINNVKLNSIISFAYFMDDKKINELNKILKDENQ